MNLLDPHLAKPEVREAIAYIVDKQAVVSRVYEPVVGQALAANGLGNMYWMANHPAYVNHQTKYDGYQPVPASNLLSQANYTRGTDGIWTHEQHGPLQLKLGTTTGDSFREAQLEIIASQLRDAGFAIDDNSAPGGLFYRDGPFAVDAIKASETGGSSGDRDLWDLAVFPWTSGPWPGGLSGIFRSRSGANPYGMDEPQFNVKSTDCDQMTSDTQRNECYNELDTFVTTVGAGDASLVVIPLTQRPLFAGFNSSVLATGAITPGFTEGGPLVNVVDYQFS